MGLFGLFKKKSDETKVGNVEDFISLTRVYFQSVIATNLGITNIRFLPDVANFKRLFKVPTQNGKLGLGEKSASRKMLMQDYGLNDNFFKEIDASVKRNCRTQNDIQSYLFMYQGFSNDLMMLMGNLMQWKFRMPSIFKKALYGMTQKTVHDVCESRKDPYSVAVIYSYLYHKEHEVNRLTIALECVRYKVGQEEAMRYIRNN